LLLRFELEGQLVDLAGELKRRVVTIFHQRDAGARVLANVERFILGERDRGCMLHGIPGHFLAVHGQHAGAPLAQTWAFGLEVEDDGVLARLQLWPFPHRALEVEQVIEEHHLALADALHAFAQEQSIAAEAPTLGDDHAFRTALGNLDLGRDGVGLVEDARCGVPRHTG
jgi:hypothetical protein